MNEDEVMNALGMGQSPFFSGGEPSLDPGLGSLLAGQPLLAMLLSQMTNTVFRQANMAPGQFFPNQNLLSQMESRAFWEDKQRAVAAGGALDRSFQIETFNNLSKAMTGSAMPGWMQSGLGSLLDFANPLLATMAPGFLDAISGPAGSRAVMTQNMYQAAWMRPDPVTGRIGWSGASTREVFEGLGADLFNPRTYDPIAMSGIRAGQGGALALDLAQRGMLPESLGTMDAVDQFAALPAAARDRVRGRLSAGLSGLSDRQVLDQADAIRPELTQVLDAMRGEGDPVLMSAQRTADKDRLKARLQEYAGALAAIRDVFGDAGMPGAPVGQLMQAMNSMTQGGLMGLAPDRVERSVRTSWALAERAGVGIQGLTGMMAQGHALAQQMGVPMAFVDDVVQGGLAYGGAFGDKDMGRSSQFADYGRDRDWHVAMRERREMGAARSQMAQGLGALAHAQEMLARSGGALGGEAGTILASALRGDAVDLAALATPAGVANLLRSGGVDAGLAGELARSRQDEFVHANKFARYVTNVAQPKEWAQFVGAAMGGVVGDTYGEGRGLELGRGLAQQMLTLNADQMASRESMIAALGSWFTDQTGAQDGEARNMVERMLMASDRAIERDPVWSRYVNTVTGSRQYNTGVDRQAAAREAQASAQARMESAIAGVGQLGPLARVANMINDHDVTDFMPAMARALGANKIEDVERAMSGVDLEGLGTDVAGSRDALVAMMGRVRELQLRFSSRAGDPAAIDALEKETNAMIRGGDQAKGLIGDTLKRLGKGSVAEALADPNVPEEEKKQLRFLDAAAQRGGVRGAAKAAEVQVGGKLAADTPREAYAAGLQLDSSAAAGDRAGLADRFLTGADETIARLGSDADSLKALGSGGLKVYDELKAARDAIAAKARDAGQSVQAYLASGDPEAKRLGGRLRTAVKAVGDRMGDKPGPAMTEDEAQRADTVVAYGKKDASERNKDRASFLRDLYGGSLSDTDRDALGKHLEGLSDEEMASLRGHMAARSELEDFIRKDVGKHANVDVVAARASAGEMGPEYKKLADRAGALNRLRSVESGGLGLSADAYRRAIDEASGHKTDAPAATQPGSGQKMVLSGTVRLDGDKLNFDGARLSPADAQGIG